MPTSILDLASPTEIAQPTTVTRAGSSTLGKDEFLKLLVAQLANQDPTKPQDSSEFVAQLAQFSALEQQQNTNGKLDSLLLGQATATQTSASAFIGKDITFEGGSVRLTAGSSPTASLNLSAAAATVTVSVANAAGQVVRTMALGAHGAGSFSAAWDGRDDQGNLMLDGTYTLSASASAADKTSIPVSLATRGTVTGVSFQDGVPSLKVGTSLVKMSSVTSIDSAAVVPTPTPDGIAVASSALHAYQQTKGL